MAMGKRLEGKTIVVTGASSGIGKSTGLSTPAIARLNLADESSNGVCANVPEESETGLDRSED